MTNASRRMVLGGGLALAGLVTTAAAPDGRVRAVAFDAFPLFDPRSITRRAVELVPDKGEALAAAWQAKLFASTWLMTTAGQYEPFATVADGALRFAAKSIGVPLSDAVRAALVAGYDEMDLWPDVAATLERLRGAGLRLAVLSNLGAGTLTDSLRRTGILKRFDAVLSTDKVRRFKPSPAAYRMATGALSLPAAQIGFAAFAGWDVAGARWFGFPTVWVNRLGAPAETIGPAPQVTSRDLSGVLGLVGLEG
jgi:2-haloacid dehalogenase